MFSLKRIKLSKNEKKLLRNVQSGVDYFPDGMSEEIISCAAAGLEKEGLIRVAWSSGHIVAATEMTDKGTAYIIENPKLLNPLNWVKIGAIAAIVSVLIAIFALCVACVKLHVIK